MNKKLNRDLWWIDQKTINEVLVQVTNYRKPIKNSFDNHMINLGEYLGHEETDKYMRVVYELDIDPYLKHVKQTWILFFEPPVKFGREHKQMWQESNHWSGTHYNYRYWNPNGFFEIHDYSEGEKATVNYDFETHTWKETT